jgi:transposase
MNILDKDTIKTRILPKLLIGKRGKKCTESVLIGIVELILYRLKTGCQWRYLPVKMYLQESYSYKTVFYHFHRWSKLGIWQALWIEILSSNKKILNCLSVQLDGSQTPVKGGIESVGYQGRKKTKTSNQLFLCDKNGIILSFSEVISGEHHDVYQIQKQFKILIERLIILDIRVDGLIINADAAFDCKELRQICAQYGIECNFKLNPKNGQINHRNDYYDDEFYAHRYVIERTFAWMDAFKALLIRFEKTTQNWISFICLACIMLYINHFK